jgi:hypothetical protein
MANGKIPQMGKSSNNFELVLLGALLALILIFHSIFNILFEEWVKHQLERYLGFTVAEMIERFGSLGFPILMAIGIVWFLYRYIQKEFSNRFQDATSSKLVCSFSMDDSGCVRRDTPITFMRNTSGVVQRFHGAADYYRIKVEAGVVAVPNSSAHLVSIKKDGVLLFDGEYLPLPFVNWELKTRADESTRKVIRNGLPEYVDLLAIGDKEIIVTTYDLAWPRINLLNGFMEPGIYEFAIAVSSPATAGTPLSLTLDWRGNKKTAQLKQTEVR